MSKKLWPYFFIAPFFIVYMVFNVFPMLYSFYISLTQWNGFSAMKYVGFQNYATLFQDQAFYRTVGNSFLIVLEAMIPCQFFALCIAVILNYTVTGRAGGALRNIYFLPYVTTPIAIGLIFMTAFDAQYGLVNQLLKGLGLIGAGIDWLNTPQLSKPLVAFVIVWRYAGYVAFMYLAGLQGVNREIYEAARIDGAGYVRTFMSIIVPIMKPIIGFQATIGVIGCLRTFEEPLMMFNGDYNGGIGYAAQTMNMRYIQISFRSGQFGYGAALGYSMFVVILATTLLFFNLSNREERLGR